jgi:hypothetical protein
VGPSARLEKKKTGVGARAALSVAPLSIGGVATLPTPPRLDVLDC